MAKQRNSKPAGFSFSTKGNGGGYAKGSVSKTIGPKSATRNISGPNINRPSVGPKKAPYHAKG
jgi:hypothetical protein